MGQRDDDDIWLILDDLSPQYMQILTERSPIHSELVYFGLMPFCAQLALDDHWETFVGIKESAVNI